MLRLFKPIAAGLGLAFFVTAFLDAPPPISLVEEVSSVLEQGVISEPQSSMVSERNVMKLGSPLSAAGGNDETELNPLAPIESIQAPVVTGAVNGTALEPVTPNGDPAI